MGDISHLKRSDLDMIYPSVFLIHQSMRRIYLLILVFSIFNILSTNDLFTEIQILQVNKPNRLAIE